jgi:hypothetical protein
MAAQSAGSRAYNQKRTIVRFCFDNPVSTRGRQCRQGFAA